ncbi:hypothetical protein FJZ36_14045 [Candidatus Poribacteria bacterium]|nr:hypothetical protein [Candidatus Poribacteria bacterium]
MHRRTLRDTLKELIDQLPEDRIDTYIELAQMDIDDARSADLELTTSRPSFADKQWAQSMTDGERQSLINALSESYAEYMRYADRLREDAVSEDDRNPVRDRTFINRLHHALSDILVDRGLRADRLYPSSDNQHEHRVSFPNYRKDVDLAYLAEDGRLLMTLSVRSQFSSIGKNVKNNIEQFAGEAAGLHGGDPSLVVGLVLLLPTEPFPALTTGETLDEPLSYVRKHAANLAHYTGRQSVHNDRRRFERACILLTDFTGSAPQFIRSFTYQLNQRNETVQITDGLSIDTFFGDLLTELKHRNPLLSELEG